MVLAGTPFSQEIDFSTGLPTGAVVYSLYGNDGTVISGYDSVSVTPSVGTLSILIIVPAAANTVATPLFETRTLVWTYTTDDGVVNGRVRYRVEKDLDFPATPEGVRSKIGIEVHELSDSNIDLLGAYAELVSAYDTGALDSYATSGDRNTLLVTNAIEATAALRVLGSLQLAVARKESSGTNTYERFSAMDWDALRADLMGYIGQLNVLVTPLIDPADFAIVFFTAGSLTDPYTGETRT